MSRHGPSRVVDYEFHEERGTDRVCGGAHHVWTHARLVEGSELSARRTLRELGIHRSTFYGWFRAVPPLGEQLVVVVGVRVGLIQR